MLVHGDGKVGNTLIFYQHLGLQTVCLFQSAQPKKLKNNNMLHFTRGFITCWSLSKD